MKVGNRSRSQTNKESFISMYICPSAYIDNIKRSVGSISSWNGKQFKRLEMSKIINLDQILNEHGNALYHQHHHYHLS
jgi:hypothetical protein